MNRPKLQDVAARAGVSVATASRVLNNRGYLSDDIRRRVDEAVAELGYRPNEIARSLIGQRSALVGLIVPTVADAFFGELATHVEGALAQRGYKMLLCDCHNTPEREEKYLDLLQGNRVDGIITSTHNRNVAGYGRADLPIVAIDRRLGEQIPTVRSDNRTGGFLATEHLIARGSRSAVHITATDHPGNERAAAYRERMAAHGLEARVMAYGFGASVDERRAAIETWLTVNPCDGVFASDDVTALMALDWARKTGRRVPEDLRIVGYDGSAALHTAVPGLTTVRQPIERMAVRAVEVLVARMTDATASVEQEPPLPVELRHGWTS
ncbi:LacI family DNA-binding transcriptional regulator [Microbacterium trichothecenolyticum]|uniref:LacI family sucrose operon transcriptional repressor n=1 Tax=Microbacterium trichothecenolyticum TaxID=69370 RepID=A0ABU0TUC4_MICTR|nr:LacI family DNA-binding transcriptional regulator [Microbacterium trichothecenolyticum]MDQ1123265.1 LacI family sucrose operon transcriptional repressor [Microbacterium trichothecenolyticum]